MAQYVSAMAAKTDDLSSALGFSHSRRRELRLVGCSLASVSRTSVLTCTGSHTPSQTQKEHIILKLLKALGGGGSCL